MYTYVYIYIVGKYILYIYILVCQTTGTLSTYIYNIHIYRLWCKLVSYDDTSRFIQKKRICTCQTSLLKLAN